MAPENQTELSAKHLAFVDEYLRLFNATRAYLRVYPESSYDAARRSASDLLTNPDIKAEITARLDEMSMTADEAVIRTAAVARGDLGEFFKVVQEWMFFPLPTYEILGEKMAVDRSTNPPVNRPCYLVRHVVLDMERVTDPQFSHLIQEFSDSRKTGLSIKLYSAREAHRDILKVHGKFVDKVDVTSNGKQLADADTVNRAITSLADALRETLSGKD